jgi:hypothetical protein
MARVKGLWKMPARRGRGKRWLAVWTGPDGRECTRAFAKKSDADRHGIAMEADQLRGTYVDPRRGAIPLRDYGELKFLPSLMHLRPNSASTYASHLRTHWWPLAGERQIRLLSRSDMKAAIATGLTAGRVDFLRRRLQVLEQAQNGALAPLKTTASRCTVPVGDWVLEEISSHLERYGTGPAQVIMSNAAGQIIRRSAFGDSWRAAVKAAGLPVGTRFHDLRHFYASAMIAANLNPKVIQARLGHATIAETMDTYAHLFPDSEDLGRGAVDDALASALAEQERNTSAL